MTEAATETDTDVEEEDIEEDDETVSDEAKQAEDTLGEEEVGDTRTSVERDREDGKNEEAVEESVENVCLITGVGAGNDVEDDVRRVEEGEDIGDGEAITGAIEDVCTGDEHA
jgi:hypothetical protein